MSSRILQKRLTEEQLKKAKLIKYTYPFISNGSNTYIVEEYTPKDDGEILYKRYKENIITKEKNVDVFESVNVYEALDSINNAIPQVAVRYYYKPKSNTLNAARIPAPRKNMPHLNVRGMF